MRVWSCPSDVLSYPGAKPPTCCTMDRVLCQCPCRDKLSLGDSRAEKTAGEQGAWQAGKPKVVL